MGEDCKGWSFFSRWSFKTLPFIPVQFCVIRGNPESQRGKFLEPQNRGSLIRNVGRSRAAPRFRIIEFSHLVRNLLCSVLRKLSHFLTHGRRIPLLMHGQFINSCFSCLLNFFATTYPQFLGHLLHDSFGRVHFSIRIIHTSYFLSLSLI